MEDLQEELGVQVAEMAVEMEPAKLGNYCQSCNLQSSRCHKGHRKALDSQSKSAPTLTSNMSLEGQVGTVLALVGLVRERESGSELAGLAWETESGSAVGLASARAEPESVLVLVQDLVVFRPLSSELPATQLGRHRSASKRPGNRHCTCCPSCP